ncbi:MAG: hypothetical protein K2M14_07670 [Muribaculaceae bacterium]|nr:hypothetical protein [Muribaculaceae bacterium]
MFKHIHDLLSRFLAPHIVNAVQMPVSVATIFMIVRQMQPTSQGLPLELSFFTNRTNRKKFEALQSDIFDYVYAMLSHFGPRMYQASAGADLRDCTPFSSEN